MLSSPFYVMKRFLSLEIAISSLMLCPTFMKSPLSRYMSLSLALRYLNPLRTYFSVITLICLLGVALGVMVLVIVLSVMGGLQKDIQGRLLRYSPHVQVSYCPIEGMRGTIADWRQLTEAASKVPGVQSSYALVEDYALVDSNGMQKPCYFRAIDTENKQQMAELQGLIREGSFDLDMGEKVVVSSLVADSLRVSVGDQLRVYTTRNFQDISETYAQMDRPLLSVKCGEQLKELQEIGKRAQTTPEGELWNLKDKARASEIVEALMSEKCRPKEREQLTTILNICYLPEDETLRADGKMVMPQGTAKQWLTTINELNTINKDTEDLASMRTIKGLILPKDLEVIGIYQASQHVVSPDLFIPLGIGQELVGFNDDFVQGIAVRVDDPYNIEAILPLIQKAMPLAKGESSWLTESWKEKYSAWFSLMQRERMMMSFVLSFIALIAAFCIMAVMFTVAIQRKKELAVMKALGATPWQIIGVFLWQGVIIGIVGAILGIGLGLLVLEYRVGIHTCLAGIGFDPFPMDFHGVEIPAEVDPAELVSQGLRAFIMVVIASVIPAIVTAYQDPAKALRSM